MNAILSLHDSAVDRDSDVDRRITASDWIGIDLIRVLAAILVVLLHASVPYLVHPMPGLAWPVVDTPSPLVDAVFWAIEVFIMPLFLVLAGYFAHRSLAAKSGRHFLRGRFKRLLVPFLAAVIVVLPADCYVWLLGWVVEGEIPLAKMRSLKLDPARTEHLWGTSHLWFLLYLYLYCVVLVALSRGLERLTDRRGLGGGVDRSSSRAATAVTWGLLVVTAVVTLAIAPEVVYGFQHSFLPVPSKWIYSGTFFAGGVWIATCDPQWRIIQRFEFRWLAFGCLALIFAVMVGQWSLRPSGEARFAADGWLLRTTLAALTVCAAWSMTLGLICAGHRLSPVLLRRPRGAEVVRYLAGASLWVYVIHHPLVGLLHIDAKLLGPTVSPVIKAMTVTMVSLSLALATYEVWIRRTVVGRRSGFAAEPRRLTVATEALEVRNDEARPTVPIDQGFRPPRRRAA